VSAGVHVARLVSGSREATERLGEVLAQLVAPGDVILLSGDLGAGKTQLTKGLARGLGVGEPVTSPTFNILLVHDGRMPLYHFDLYRLEHAEELDDIDYWGTLEAGGVSVVEWGDRFAEALPGDGIDVAITITGDDSREIDVHALGPRGRELGPAWQRAVEACA
jgi:tRNA threonylcarbamoyladenosine biosynthesis protein TsaE